MLKPVTLAKLLATALLFYLAFSKINLIHFAETIKTFGFRGFIVCLALITIQNLLAFYRWLYILKTLDIKIKFKYYLDYYYLGLFLNQTIPLAIGGDIVRALLLIKLNNIDAKKAINSAIIDRIFPLVSLTTMFIFMSVIWIKYVNKNYIYILMLLILAFILSSRIDFFKKIYLKFFNRVSSLIELNLFNLKDFFCITLIGILGFTLMAYLIFYISSSTGGGAKFVDILALSAPIFLIASLPISIGGWGSREFGMIYFLGLMSYGEARALEISILLGIIVFLGTFPGLLSIQLLRIENLFKLPGKTKI